MTGALEAVGHLVVSKTSRCDDVRQLLGTEQVLDDVRRQYFRLLETLLGVLGQVVVDFRPRDTEPVRVFGRGHDVAFRVVGVVLDLLDQETDPELAGEDVVELLYQRRSG
ncbi:hypothetical protein D3C75_1163050 [compost metagenome]